ncbi:hypothetical protein [Streptomyces avidinii]
MRSVQVAAGPALAVIEAHRTLFAELAAYPPGKAPAELQAEAVREVGLADLTVVQKAQPQLKVLQEHGPQVAAAAKDGPGEWRTWWFVCVGGQILFLPFVFVMKGRWSPRRAREDAADHQSAVDRELQRLALTQPAASPPER